MIDPRQVDSAHATKLLSSETAILLRLLESARRDYDEACDNWKLIETKAQSTAAAAGVFIGGIFVSRRPDPSHGQMTAPYSPGWWLLLAVVLALLVSCAFALRALWIRGYQQPHDESDLRVDANAFKGSGIGYLTLQEAAWIELEFQRIVQSSDKITDQCNDKADAVQWAQRAFGLAVALLCMAVFAGV